MLAISDAQWGIIGTSSLALATVLVQLTTTARERKHQRDLQVAERDHTDAVRRRTECATVYLDLLTYMHGQTRAMLNVERLSDLKVPRDDEVVELRAKIGAVGSKPVRSHFDSFLDTMSQIGQLVKTVAEGSAGGAAWTDFQHAREQLKSTTFAVEGEVTEELR
ncbi:MAG: hypothetical protein JWL83_1947 [Actinomycetia bacterium]|nr:hypothetical protein [Actinomycetes bacterium]